MVPMACRLPLDVFEKLCHRDRLLLFLMEDMGATGPPPQPAGRKGASK